MTKHIEAIDHLIATGDEVGAFQIALQDEGINPNVTFREWRKFAEKCIARRCVEEGFNSFLMQPIRTRECYVAADGTRTVREVA